MMETPDRFNQLLYNFITEQPLDTIHTDPDTHRIDIEDEHIHTRWSNLDDESHKYITRMFPIVYKICTDQTIFKLILEP
jgi:hypothetical protein